MATILIVEDEANQRALYQVELEQDGYTVLTAADGKDAIQIAEEHNPDLVIMDVRMPRMDGIEAMGRILSRNNTVPVIINTAYSSYKDNFMTWAADRYVVKSSDMADLKAAIREVLGGGLQEGSATQP